MSNLPESIQKALETYHPTRIELALSLDELNFKGHLAIPTMRITSKGVYMFFGNWPLTLGEMVAYPDPELTGKLVTYKYGANFKTVDNALKHYHKWVEEFITINDE